MVVVADVGRQAGDILGLVGLDLALSQEGKPVPVPPANIVVFESGVFDRLEEVNGLWLQLVSLGTSLERE